MQTQESKLDVEAPKARRQAPDIVLCRLRDLTTARLKIAPTCSSERNEDTTKLLRKFAASEAIPSHPPRNTSQPAQQIQLVIRRIAAAMLHPSSGCQQASVKMSGGKQHCQEQRRGGEDSADEDVAVAVERPERPQLPGVPLQQQPLKSRGSQTVSLTQVAQRALAGAGGVGVSPGGDGCSKGGCAPGGVCDVTS